jgi:YVTN family beta-propeller protein
MRALAGVVLPSILLLTVWMAAPAQINTTTVTTGPDPDAVVVNTVTNQIFVANTGSTTVTVVDGLTNAPMTVSVGTTPGVMAVNEVTNQVFVANPGANTVTVIDAANNYKTTTVTVGTDPVGPAVNAETNKVYVVNKTSNNVTVIDDHSRFVIALEATGRPDGGLVKVRLERAFERCGVPEAMLMDHGTPWWNWQSFSGRTQLSLWLMRQGIGLHWSGIRHPQTQGKVERFHGSLQRALDRRGVPDGDCQAWLDVFRLEHNYIRPHEALGMQTPAELWQPSPRSYNPCPPAWEYPAGAWTLKVDCQGTIDIHDRRWRIGKTLAGERVRIEPVEQRFLVYYCNTLVRELDPAMKRSTIVERFIENQKQSQ